MDDKKLIKEISEKVKKTLNAVFLNTMSVSNQEGVSIRFLWRPNNYRYVCPINKDNFHPTHPNKPIFPVEIKSTNYNSKHIQKIDDRTTIMVDKEKITCIYSLKEYNRKMWYLVEANSLEDLETRIKQKINDIKSYCVLQMNRFTKVYGGRISESQGYWSWYEDGIHGEDYLDKIPREHIVHDTIFKKVYKGEFEDDLEFRKPKGQLKGEPALHLKNTITNLAIKNTAPELIKEIQNIKLATKESLDNHSKEINDIKNDFAKSLEELKTQALIPLREQIKLHLGVETRTEENLGKMNLILDKLNETLNKKPFFMRWIDHFKKK